ncbi:AraC family transcriptional regulator, partial [Bifidobacterium callitrichidarum]|uniref:AraC family transcriptional regulator n=1 Tax=Bifidobacterium callitrichidarum TaxID=2052941 RepID=UPI003BABE46B
MGKSRVAGDPVIGHAFIVPPQSERRVAVGLLKATDLPVSAVAACCGFNSSNYFTRVFR